MSSMILLGIGSLVSAALGGCGNRPQANPDSPAAGQPAPSQTGTTLTDAYSVRQVAALRTARAAHTATSLTSGEVLVVGGMADDDQSIASVELFDPATNTLRELSSLAEPRVSHTATLLSNGSVL